MAQHPSIAIIGGGPSGLTFARLLETHGITDYVVYERDASATPGPGQQGGTLDLHVPSGQLALRRAGLFEEFSRVARWESACVHILDNTGKTVLRIAADPNDPIMDRPEIDRLQLRRLLLDSVPEEKIRWGHAVKIIEQENTEGDKSAGRSSDYVIRFANGTSATGFRLIVGADGAWSRVRSVLTPAKPIYSGKMYIEGHISHNNPTYAAATNMAGRGNMLAMGEGKQLNVQQMADGSYRTYFGLVVPEDFHRTTIELNTSVDGTEAARRLFLSSADFYASWPSHLRAFIEHAEGPFRPWPLYHLNSEEIGWKRETAARGVTLLGDAAHLSTPSAGEGVNCSMHDAIVLFDRILEQCKDGEGSDFVNVTEEALERALADYEKNTFARGRDLILESSVNEKFMFANTDGAVQFVDHIMGGGSKEQENKGHTAE